MLVNGYNKSLSCKGVILVNFKVQLTVPLTFCAKLTIYIFINFKELSENDSRVDISKTSQSWNTI